MSFPTNYEIARQKYLIQMQEARRQQITDFLKTIIEKYRFLQTRPGFDPIYELLLHQDLLEEGDLVRLKSLT